MSQNTMSLEMKQSVAGLEGDSAGAAKVRDTYIASEQIGFGLAVAKDTAGAELCKLPETGEDILGVAVRDIAEPNGSASVDNAYPEGSAVCVLKQGKVWVVCEDTVTPADDVFVRIANGDLGRFRTDADGGDAVQLSNARYLTSADGITTGYALLEINNP